MFFLLYAFLFTLVMFMIMVLFFKGELVLLTMVLLNTMTWISFDFMNNLMSLLSLIILILSFFITYYCSVYMDSYFQLNRFMWIMLSFVMSMLILTLSKNCWVVWIGWEGLGITSFMLIMYYSNCNSNNSSITTLMLNRVGDYTLMMSMVYFSFMYMWKDVNHKINFMLSLILIISIFAKSAQIPFQSWLPIAMAAPTPVSSLVHSSTLVVAGSILCLKYMNYFNIMSIMIITMMSFITGFYSSFMALIEKDLKKTLAYSTMSQISLVLFMLSSNLNILSITHIMNHALVKALAFMNMGLYISFFFGSQESRYMKMKTISNHMISFMLVISLMVMSGIFLTSCSYTKEFLLMYFMNRNTATYLINLMIFMSFLYSIRMLKILVQNNNYNLNINQTNKNYTMNLILFLMSMIYGWFMFFNYSFPFNMMWSFKNNMTMILPLIFISMVIMMWKHTILGLSLNMDNKYKIINNMVLKNINYVLLKNKNINMSKWFNFFNFNFKNLSMKYLLMLLIVFLMMMF